MNPLHIPIPPPNLQQSFDDIRIEAILDDFRRIAADNGERRDVLDDDAV